MENFVEEYLKLSQKEKDELALAIGRDKIKKRLEAERVVGLAEECTGIKTTKEVRARLVEIFTL